MGRRGVSLSRECQYSYADLFEAVRGRAWTQAEQREFEALMQPQRNAWVKDLAGASGGTVGTEDRVGTDGEIYTAFWL